MISNLKEMTSNAMSFTEEVTTRWDDRLTGSKACLACGDYLLECFDKFCDSTRMHDFDVRPGAFLGYLRINIVLYFIALICLWLQLVYVAGLFATMIAIIAVCQFFYYKEFVDFLFPKKKGQNIVGNVEPSGEVKQQIIISAHHDSAHVFNFLVKDSDKFATKVLLNATGQFGIGIGTWFLIIGQLLNFSMTIPTYIVAGIFTLLAYSMGSFWFFYSKNGTPGAGDNMVCTAIAMEVAKYFSTQKRKENGLKHTRVIVASWDAEEAGLRGARAYLKSHGEDFKTIPTYNFNLECMYDHTQLAFLTSDLNSFVPLSSEMVEEGMAIAKQLDYEIHAVPFPFLAGGTDAAEFAKQGIEATTLAAMNWVERGNEPAYHTPRDTIESVDAEAVSRSIHIGIEYVLKKERESI